MAGIYIHIPYCRHRCSYCDFHFSTILNERSVMASALTKELILRKDYIAGATIQTIYFGGGTPSILSDKDIEKIFTIVFSHYSVSRDAEITLEANPDDLTPDKIKFLHDSPVNRLSIGVQSFFDDELQFMCRSHSGKQAIESIEQSKKAGFENITIDLIYGIPNATHWKQNIAFFLDFNLFHLSSYALTVESKTALSQWIKTKKTPNIEEYRQQQEYNFMVAELLKNGFEQYEISNFAKNKNYSRHNSSYWQSKPYLGIGPSAHSYNGISRQWNLRNNTRYIKAIEQDKTRFDHELLNDKEKYNELVMLGLRTIWGIDFEKVNKLGSFYATYLLKQSEEYRKQGKILFDGVCFTLNPKYRFFADGIAADLFFSA